MEIGKLHVSCVDTDTILDMEIAAGVNRHAALKLACIVACDKAQRYVSLAETQEPLVLTEDSTVLFHGVVEKAACKIQKNYALLELNAMSGSIRLDKEQRTMSYQDTTMTCGEIIGTKTRCMYYPQDKPMGTIALQYMETDWAFIQRMAAKNSQCIYPDMTRNPDLVLCGIDTARPEKEMHVLRERIEKDMEKERTTYVLDSDTFLTVGDAIRHDGQKLYVYALTCSMDKAGFHAVYRAMRAEDIICEPVELYDMAGAALEGKIIAVQGEKVKVHLNVDAQQPLDIAYWFPFSTMQSASDGSGWYYMPEEGDCVKVCIPGWEETGAFAVSAVSTYTGEEDTQDRMSDTNTKYMRNPSGKELKLTPDSIRADVGAGASALGMDTAGKVTLSAKTELRFIAEETIQLVAEQNIEMQASKTIDIKADTTGELLLNEEGEIRQLGGQVNINSENE